MADQNPNQNNLNQVAQGVEKVTVTLHNVLFGLASDLANINNLEATRSREINRTVSGYKRLVQEEFNKVKIGDKTLEQLRAESKIRQILSSTYKEQLDELKKLDVSGELYTQLVKKLGQEYKLTANDLKGMAIDFAAGRKGIREFIKDSGGLGNSLKGLFLNFKSGITGISIATLAMKAVVDTIGFVQNRRQFEQNFMGAAGSPLQPHTFFGPEFKNLTKATLMGQALGLSQEQSSNMLMSNIQLGFLRGRDIGPLRNILPSASMYEANAQTMYGKSTFGLNEASMQKLLFSEIMQAGKKGKELGNYFGSLSKDVSDSDLNIQEYIDALSQLTPSMTRYGAATDSSRSAVVNFGSDLKTLRISIGDIANLLQGPKQMGVSGTAALPQLFKQYGMDLNKYMPEKYATLLGRATPLESKGIIDEMVEKGLGGNVQAAKLALADRIAVTMGGTNVYSKRGALDILRSNAVVGDVIDFTLKQGKVREGTRGTVEKLRSTLAFEVDRNAPDVREKAFKEKMEERMKQVSEVSMTAAKAYLGWKALEETGAVGGTSVKNWTVSPDKLIQDMGDKVASAVKEAAPIINVIIGGLKQNPSQVTYTSQGRDGKSVQSPLKK